MPNKIASLVTSKGRECTKCRYFKMRDQFKADPRYAGGMFTWCNQCVSTYCSDRRQKNYKRVRQIEQASRLKCRIEVLSHYSGGGKPHCQCCGEDTLEFLCIDHINGGGNKHRKSLSGRGFEIYLWLRRSKFPAGYQTLCHNCNMAKGLYGTCPHQR